jgi:hypothetical protein
LNISFIKMPKEVSFFCNMHFIITSLFHQLLRIHHSTSYLTLCKISGLFNRPSA